MTTEARLYYAHDPMCSWCWAFAPTWDKLERELGSYFPEQLRVEKLLGGLAPDSDATMPEAMQQHLQHTWSAIQQRVPGTQFNFDFWRQCKPRRSTWPACRAVIAARNQERQFDSLMTWAIQQAYYLQAKNPSDRDTLISLAGDIGADQARFAAELDADSTRDHHQKEMDLVRQLGFRVFLLWCWLKDSRPMELKWTSSTPSPCETRSVSCYQRRLLSRDALPGGLRQRRRIRQRPGGPEVRFGQRIP